jgi:hypothetical protein
VATVGAPRDDGFALVPATDGHLQRTPSAVLPRAGVAGLVTGRPGRDLPWLLGTAAALLVLCGLPYVVSTLAGPKDVGRVGTFWFSQDFSQYAAAMREGAGETGWLIHDHFSAEPHAAVLMYPLYVGIGKLAALLGLNNLTLFVATEWLGRLAVLGGAYVFATTFIEERRPRRLAVLLTLGALGLDAWAAGLGLLLNAAGLPSAANLLPDRINPYLEMSSFGVLLSAPHLMLGLALTLVCAPIYVHALTARPRWLAALGAATLGLSLVHPFNLPVLVSVIVAHAALTGRRAWPAAIVACMAAAPMTLYSLLVFQADPFWSATYGAQNSMPAPAPWSLPIDFGLVLLAAPLAWRAVRHWPVERHRLIWLWIGLGLLSMYAPVPYQRRLGFGVQPALAVLAAVGLVDLNGWLRAHRVGSVRRRLVNYSLAIAATSTSLLVYASLLGSAVHNQPAEVYLWTLSEADAGEWLGSHSTTQDVVLASTAFANPLVGVIDGRVVHGHIVATLDSPGKAALVSRFYAADALPAERSRILRASRATLVALGPQERALGATELGSQPELELIYDREGVALFRVR